MGRQEQRCRSPRRGRWEGGGRPAPRGLALAPPPRLARDAVRRPEGAGTESSNRGWGELLERPGAR